MKRWILFALLSLAGSIANAETTLYDFYADWCPPCQSMAPTIDSLAQDGFSVVKVNVDRDGELAARFGVERVPQYIVVERGQEVDRVVGPATKDRLKLKLRIKDRPEREPRPQQPHPAWRYEDAAGHRAAVVRIYCRDSATHRSIGSGVLIRWKGRLAVLTARHVVKDAKHISVELRTKRVHRANLLKVDATWDCAVLELEGQPDGVEPATIEFGPSAVQKDGDRLESCGYGPDGKLAVNSGLFLGYRRSTIALQGPDDWMVISGHARGGDSGGPVFNSRGRLVGILWGTDGQEVVCVQAGRVHELLDAALPGVQQRAFAECYSPELPQFIRRQPTPPKACCPGDNCPQPVDIADLPVTATAASEEQRQYLLKFRNEVAQQQAGNAAKLSGIEQQLQSLDSRLQQIANVPGTPPAAVSPPATPIEPEKPQTIRDKIDDAKERIEAKGGLVGRLIRQIDEHDPKWLLVVIGLIIAIAVWRRGGIHTIVEGKRVKLEEDAEGTGLKARLAQRVLSIHDGELGQKLAEFEAQLSRANAKADVAAEQAKIVADQVTQVALATPTTATAPTTAA